AHLQFVAEFRSAARRCAAPSSARIRSADAMRRGPGCREELTRDGTGTPARNFSRRAGEKTMSVGTIILIILVIALLGGFSGIGGGPFYGTGYYGGGGLGLVIVILLILVLMGRI